MAGRRAAHGPDVAFTYNYIIKNQLANFTDHDRHRQDATAPDDTTVVITCSQPKANMLAIVGADPAAAHLGHVSAQGRGQQLPERRRSSAPARSRSCSGARATTSRMMANKDYWGGAPKVDEIIFEFYQNPTRWCRT